MGQFDVDQTENGFAAPKKWQRVADLLHAKLKVKNISDMLG